MKNLSQLTGKALDRAMIKTIQTGTQSPPPAKEKPVWEYAGQVQLEPKPVKVRQTSVMDALRKLASKDELRPALTYVYSAGDEAFATDGMVMMVVKGARIPSGWYRDMEEFYPLGHDDMRYPDCNAVIPAKDQTLCRKVRLADVLAMANAARQAHKYFFNPMGFLVMLEDGDRYAYVAYQKLYEITRAMMQVGETEVEMQVNGPSRAVVFWGVKATGLVMPLMSYGKGDMLAPNTKF